MAGDDDTGDAKLMLCDLWKLGLTWDDKTDGAGTDDADGFDDAYSVKAVKFSPNYAMDKIVLTVTENTSATATGIAQFQVYWNEQDAETWNDQITGFGSGYSSTNLKIIDLAMGETLDSASLSVSLTYMGYDEGSRIVFTAVATSDGNGGAHRFADYFRTEIKSWVGTNVGPIHSLAYHEWGKLLAGDYDDNQVLSCLSPMAFMPKFERVNSLKQPGGENATLVSWSGDIAVAATSGDESVFAISIDAGYAFNDIRMIDTELDIMSDIAVNADGSKVYLATHDTSEGSGNYDVSVWVRASSWARVLSMKNMADDNASFLIRIAPEDDSAVYISSKGTNNMWVSKDSGKTTWKSVPCYKLDFVQDFAVESTDVVYAVGSDHFTNSVCSKTINAGSSWGKPTDPGLTGGDIHMIDSIDGGEVIVGGTTGYVAYSSDGSASWANIGQQIESGALLTQVTASGLANGDYIYAASSKPDTKVVRWQIGTSTDWTDMMAPTSAGYGAYGIALHEGALYVVNSDNIANSELLWTNEPTASTVAWNVLPSPGETFNSSPSTLVVSSGSVKLWVIDTISNRLFSCTETPTEPDGEEPIEVGGEVSYVNKLALLVPWIALSAAIIAGGTIVLIHRRAQG